jgi:iron complex transport system substrate-binding protein
VRCGRPKRGIAGSIVGLLASLTLAAPVAASPRIISLDQCADQYVLALAPRDEIVALSKRALDADSHERGRAQGLPEQRANLEAALAARPTIAVRYWTADARLPQALQRFGVKVVQIDEAGDFAAVRADVRKVAAALGRPAAGEAVIARMDGELAASHGAWRGARALYLTTEGFTSGPGTLVAAMMTAAGLAPLAAAPGYAPMRLEALVLNPPAALVLGFFRDLAGGRQHWTIAGNGYLRGLVQRRAVASLPGRVLGCPAWFAAEGSLALAQTRSGVRSGTR